MEGKPMSRTLRLKISGLDDEIRVAALKRSLGLVADVQGVVVDPERGEVLVSGDPEEHRVVVHLANEGFEAHPVHEPVHQPAADGPASARASKSGDETRIKGASNHLSGKGESQVRGKAKQSAGQVRDTFASARRTTRGDGSTMGAELDGFMAARPMTALLIAAGFGYVLARLTLR